VRSAAAGLVALLIAGPPGAEEAAPPRIQGIAHVAFRASDLAQSRRFYEGFLGLRIVSAASAPTAPLLVAISERQTVEILAGLDPAEDRLDHVAFQVDDLERARRVLSARGIAFSSRGDAVDIRDPEGHALELVTLSPVTHDGGAPHAISRRLLHAGILVGALEEARAFYEKLGFREIWRGSRSGTELSWTTCRSTTETTTSSSCSTPRSRPRAIAGSSITSASRSRTSKRRAVCCKTARRAPATRARWRSASASTAAASSTSTTPTGRGSS
jgi:catechol 2,3-dioxygenase-like lactoylglutathione lyase family enzyme